MTYIARVVIEVIDPGEIQAIEDLEAEVEATGEAPHYLEIEITTNLHAVRRRVDNWLERMGYGVRMQIEEAEPR